MRKKIVAGNWKMNTDPESAVQLASDIKRLYWADTEEKAELILAPPFPFLSMVYDEIKGKANIGLAAQNLHFAPAGAFTGEVSAAMLKSVGCGFVIIGHSERREHFGETNELLSRKVDAAINQGLRPIFCLGESLEQRQNGQTPEVVSKQLQEGTFHLDAAGFGQIILAYEPVWAIGTGVTATPEQAQDVHAHLRGLVKEKFGDQVAEDCTILYGGSVQPGNAWELFKQKDIDGGLVGGASLIAEHFIRIVKGME